MSSTVYGLMIAVSFLTVILVGGHTSHSQNSNCPGTTSQKWPKNKTVYYSTGTLDSTQKGAVDNAITKWNEENQINGSGVKFEKATSTNPAKLIFKLGGVPGTEAAHMDPTTNSSGQIISATITFDLSNLGAQLAHKIKHAKFLWQMPL